jgi:protein SCO1/2
MRFLVTAKRKFPLRNLRVRIGTTLFLLPFIVLTNFRHALSHEPDDLRKSPGAQRREVRIPIRDFQLIDQNGRVFEFKTVRKKVVVVAFAYTTCPDICPLITAAMRQVQTELKHTERSSVFFLTVTTDPEVDSPKVLSAYARRYGADLSGWAFLTGQEAALQGIWHNFGVRVVKKARGLVDHTSLTAVIDQTGTARFAYYGTSPDPKVVLRDVRSLFARP